MASLPFIPLYRYNRSIVIWFLLKNKKLRYQAFEAFYRNFKQSFAWSLFAVSNFCHVQINGLQIKKWRGVSIIRAYKSDMFNCTYFNEAFSVVYAHCYHREMSSIPYAVTVEYICSYSCTCVCLMEVSAFVFVEY